MKLGLKFGFKMLLRNPVRIAASLLAAIAAFGIAGMCIFFASYRTIAWEHELYFKYNDDKYTNIIYTTSPHASVDASNITMSYEDRQIVEQALHEIGGGYAISLKQDGRATSAGWMCSYGAYRLPDHFAFPPEETTVFYEYRGKQLIAPYAKNWAAPQGDVKDGSDRLYDDFYAAMTIYGGEDAPKEFGYELVGRLPDQENEVAIPQWLYNCFLCYGYKDREGNVFPITGEDDLIGKKITLVTMQPQETAEGSQDAAYQPQYFDGTIVGVVHTDFVSEKLKEQHFDFWKDSEKERYSGLNFFEYSLPPYLGIVYSRACLEKARDADGSHVAVNCMTVLRHGSHAEEYFDYITAWKSQINYFEMERISDGVSQKYPAYVLTLIGSILYGGMPNIFRAVEGYFRIVPYLGVFAAILLAYLCFSTVMGRRRGVGTLQSLGASKKQIALAVGIPIFVFCLIASLGALCVEVCFLFYMNGLLSEQILDNLVFWGEFFAWEGIASAKIYPFTLGWETVLFTFGVPLAIAAVATLVTVWLVFRAPVVDNLNKKEFRLFSKKAR